MAEERLVCDAEVFQEILHRYTAVDRREAIGPAFDLLLSLIDEVFPIEIEDVQRARQIVSGNGSLSARDAIHIAVMERYGIRTIFTFDRDYDRWPGLNRISKP